MALEPLRPATLVREELPRLAAACRSRPALDLACGRGRNALAAAAAGIAVVGIDRDPGALTILSAEARARGARCSALRADLESGWGIPVRPASCGGILVFRFLFRPLARAIVECLAPGGLLLYETFTIHQRSLGHGPRNPAFLLEPGELPRLFAGLEVLAAWEGTTEGSRPEALARLTARRALR